MLQNKLNTYEQKPDTLEANNLGKTSLFTHKFYLITLWNSMEL